MSSQSTALPVYLVLYLAMIAQNAWMPRYHQHRSHRHQVRKLRDPHCTTIVPSVNIYLERTNFEMGEYVCFAHTGHLRVFTLILISALPVQLALFLAMIDRNVWMLRYPQHRSHRHQVRKLRNPHCTTIVPSVNIYLERTNYVKEEHVCYAHMGRIRMSIRSLISALPVQLALFLAMIDRNVWMLLLTERCFLLSNIQQFSMCIPCTSNSDPICAVLPPPRST